MVVCRLGRIRLVVIERSGNGSHAKNKIIYKIHRSSSVISSKDEIY